MLLSGTTGARWGEHSPAVPGSVLLQEQALRRGVRLRPALLWLQRCKCSRVLPAVVADSVGTHRCFLVTVQAREEGKALLRQISQVRDQVETPSADLLAPLSTNNTPVRRVSPLNLISFTPWHPLACTWTFRNSDVEYLTLNENVPGKELCENKHLLCFYPDFFFSRGVPFFKGGAELSRWTVVGQKVLKKKKGLKVLFHPSFLNSQQLWQYFS